MPSKTIKSKGNNAPNNDFLTTTIAIRSLENNEFKTFYLFRRKVDSPLNTAFAMKQGNTKIVFKLSFQEIYKLYLILSRIVKSFEESEVGDFTGE